MTDIFSFAIFLASLSLSASFLDDNNACRNSLVKEHTACTGFFDDMQNLETSLSSLQSAIRNLQLDLEYLSVRLVNGTSYRGLVQIFSDGYWGSICDQDWDIRDANVVCQMLGFNHSRSILKGLPTTAPYFTSRVQCGGFEKTIFECTKMSPDLNYGCDYNRAAGVDCQMGLRLVGSTVDNNRGRVEIQHLGEWGTICDTVWTNEDAAVVCRMLGLRGGRAISGAAFGAGTGRIILSNVRCSGTESHLMDCQHSPFRVHTCQHSADVGVVCDPASSGRK